jgi:hypothetical protein
MRALGITAPEASVTVPRKPASLTDCARAEVKNNNTATAKSQAPVANLDFRITASKTLANVYVGSELLCFYCYLFRIVAFCISFFEASQGEYVGIGVEDARLLRLLKRMPVNGYFRLSLDSR